MSRLWTWRSRGARLIQSKQTASQNGVPRRLGRSKPLTLSHVGMARGPFGRRGGPDGRGTGALRWRDLSRRGSGSFTNSRTGTAPGSNAMAPADHNEKQSAALGSLGAAVFLTAMKIVVGLLSGSLGILAEAAHSTLDFAAAFITVLAVRAASKPADQGHAYGHGKVENLSALVETLLLLGTCAWIIYQSISRLVGGRVDVKASIWTFAVMLVSILVDLSRSRMLYRIALKHRSQALEADALHFSSDVWSSVVVIVGLIGVKIGQANRSLAWLEKADALAGLVVAAIVVYVSLKLGFRSIQALIDASPEGVAEKIKSRVEQMEMVFDCHAVRVRHAGPRYFVDLHITLDGNLTLNAAHDLTEQVEKAVSEILPEADVTVHPEPTNPPGARAGDKARPRGPDGPASPGIPPD